MAQGQDVLRGLVTHFTIASLSTASRELSSRALSHSHTQYSNASIFLKSAHSVVPCHALLPHVARHTQHKCSTPRPNCLSPAITCPSPSACDGLLHAMPPRPSLPPSPCLNQVSTLSPFMSQPHAKQQIHLAQAAASASVRRIYTSSVAASTTKQVTDLTASREGAPR